MILSEEDIQILVDISLQPRNFIDSLENDILCSLLSHTSITHQPVPVSSKFIPIYRGKHTTIRSWLRNATHAHMKKEPLEVFGAMLQQV